MPICILPRLKRVEHIQDGQNSESHTKFGEPDPLNDANLTPELKGSAGAVADDRLNYLCLSFD